MFEYMTVQEASTKWNISEQRVQTLCSENGIEGIVHLSRVA
ncbi:MAG: helix-turn-helix domain-containing protein [Clostridiales bacterium]|nr:helix-turn-helix domain-containing protein [Clostridiales bacterium]